MPPQPVSTQTAVPGRPSRCRRRTAPSFAKGTRRRRSPGRVLGMAEKHRLAAGKNVATELWPALQPMGERLHFARATRRRVRS